MSHRFELAVERHIAAPPSRVWQIMTERITDWWCPKPWTTTVVDLDWRDGGAFHLLMRGPQGETDSMPEENVGGVLLEFVRQRRFVFTDAFAAGWIPQKAFMVGTFEISPDGEGTHYHASARHWDEAGMEQHRKMGFDEGWTAVARQLAELAEGR